MKLNRAEITDVEIELTGMCQLNCRLCSKNFMCIKPMMRDFESLKSQLDSFSNLKSIGIAGTASEPTLYPELIQLIKYLNNRKITIELYTNGEKIDNNFWTQLATELKLTDKVIFTICGSTQQVHEKYRVGSNLKQLLENARTVRKVKKIDELKIIRFEYNQFDIASNSMTKIREEFTTSHIINSLPYQERFQIIQEETNICMPSPLPYIYFKLDKNNKSKIACRSLASKFLYIDNEGNEYPCILYKKYLDKNFDLDYTAICNGQYDFCYECRKQNRSRMLLTNIPEMV